MVLGKIKVFERKYDYMFFDIIIVTYFFARCIILVFAIQFQLLGIPVRPAIRAQINVRIWRHLDTSQSNNPPIVYPVLWQEIVRFFPSLSTKKRGQ